MKNRFFILVLLLITSNIINAQFGYGKLEDIQKIKEIPLFVVLEKESDDTKDYNIALKNAFEKNWNFTSEIRIISNEEFKKLNIKANKGKYAYFTKVVHKGDNGFSLIKSKGLITTHDFTLSIIKNKKHIHSMMYPSLIPNEADFKFIIQQTQFYLQGRVDYKSGKKSKKDMLGELSAKAGTLKNRILLLDKEDLTPQLIKDIEKIYPFKYKITTKDEIDLAILNNNGDMAYIKVVPVGQMTDSNGPIKISKLIHVQYVIDAKDGQVLTYVRPKSFGLGGAVGTALYNSKKMLTVKDLKKIKSSISKSN